MEIVAATSLQRLKSDALELVGESRRRCPLCDSGQLEYEFVVEKTPVCRCVGCGLLFLNPVPAKPNAPAEDKQHSSLDSTVLAEIYRANATERLRDLIDYGGLSQGSLLVVGADRPLIEEAGRAGFQTSTREPQELLDEKFSGGELYDAALLFCALERTNDPLLVLTNLRRSLAPGAALMIISPTLDTTAARLFKHKWWEFQRDNLFYFSVDTMQSFLLKAGFVEPLITADRSLISLNYLRKRLAMTKNSDKRLRWLRQAFSLTPFFRNRRFRNLHSRTRFLVRAGVPQNNTRLSVIVPVFNEKETCTELLDQLLAKTIADVEIEVVIVESNSTDGSRELVMRYGDHPRVRLLLEPKPMGKGHAVRTALAAATGDIVLFQDADLEYDLNDYEGLLAPILSYRQNFVLGSRHSQSRTSWKIRNFSDAPVLAGFFNFGHLLFLTMFNTLYGQKLSDPFTMFKVFRRQCLYGFAFECNRFDFDYEIVIKLLRKGYVPKELPVNYTSRSIAEGKKVTMFRDPITWIQAMLRFRRAPLYARGGAAHK